jgi:hypothetical protein
VLLVVLAGCGGQHLTKVSGTVTYKGKPAKNATVFFSPDGGGITGAATTDGQGKYTLGCNLGIGVPPGPYSVKIKSKVEPVQQTDPMAGLEPGSPEYAEAYQRAREGGRSSAYKTKAPDDAIPAKYETGEELKAVVDNTDSQEINFDLE